MTHLAEDATAELYLVGVARVDLKICALDRFGDNRVAGDGLTRA
ncbi:MULTISPECIES: hypothetical protein [unclassified Mesorhizobium]|nr:hypothetical protein [Mesorhizobium sp. LSJC268A00]